MTTSPDYYAVLHLGPDASAGDVGRAYRSLMRRHISWGLLTKKVAWDARSWRFSLFQGSQILVGALPNY
ncbi:hypothetical protein [Arthrobacter sp. H14-L1]|uniref:hypothetical protein n=1 Tax=Arthrobacter sp. H14-L1 TaxID=2996697 RepID=UPI00226D44CF|nr:hypothetical protein [Arthrobacter sp. H14-L1]MCY0903640.1 hypothetical protein [Arthrobacter sp. H14-L1]